MASNPIIADQGGLSSAVPSSTPSPAPQPAQQAAPAAQPAQPQSRLNTVLGAIVSATSPQPATTAATPNTPPAQPAWKKDLSTGLGAVSAGLAGVPAGGRPSFMGGLGQGARSEQAAIAQQQAVKFKSFDDQVRMAELHNQDLKMQNDTQEQTDAHQKAELDMRAFANEHGINYDTLPNGGSAVMDHLQAQTAANGAASVPPGTHVSADGKSIYMPQPGQQTQDGQKTMYNQLAPALGLPAANGDFVPPKMMNMLTNKINGFDINGSPIKHEELPEALSQAQAQRDNIAKNGGSDAQLKTLDNMIGIYKANLSSLDSHAAGVAGQTAQAVKAGQDAADTSPTAIAGEQKKAAGVKQAQLDVENSPSNQASQVQLAANKAAAEEAAKGNDKLVVAYDSGYGNSDGTKGANVVMTKGEAQTKGLQHYGADGAKINATVAGFNDVQNKINTLADVASNPDKMAQVQGGLAATLLKGGFGIEIGAFGTKVDVSKINTQLYQTQLAQANQATRDYVTAMGAAHEAITQLPRLQTFGQSSRMTQQQMEAAQKMLPAPGDDGPMALQKMTALQTTIDPLRKQLPHMQGAESMPSWLEKRGQQQQTPSPAQAAPTPVGNYDPSTRSVTYSRGPQ
jgi:hypothetical protein